MSIRLPARGYPIRVCAAVALSAVAIPLVLGRKELGPSGGILAPLLLYVTLIFWLAAEFGCNFPYAILPMMLPCWGICPILTGLIGTRRLSIHFSVEVVSMWTAWLLLTLNGLFFTLRLAGNTGSFPQALTREEEQDCLERMAKGDEDARDLLIEHNLRLVAHIVKKYYTPNGDQDDLISIGTIGLIKGVSTFKPDKNVRLATYASRCIENEILMYFRSQRKLQGELSLSDSLDGDGENGSLSLIDVVRVDDNMLEELDLRDACAKVRHCVDACLNDREAHIIRLRYGLGDNPPLTQREIAALCGISRSYVSRRA